ncbi:hypothetical protein QJS66_06740 [Kocuria rhizophila]|nr:hypothetical protein QJS66_06740 [Kocuria rhizophila]
MAAVLARVLVLVLAGGAWRYRRPYPSTTPYGSPRATVSRAERADPDPDALPDNAGAAAGCPRSRGHTHAATTPRRTGRAVEPSCRLAHAVARMARLSVLQHRTRNWPGTLQPSVAASWWAAQQTMGAELRRRPVSRLHGRGPLRRGRARRRAARATPAGTSLPPAQRVSSGGTGFESARPGAMPGTADAGSPTGTETPCQEDLLAAATALDRSAFTAEAASAATADGRARTP